LPNIATADRLDGSPFLLDPDKGTQYVPVERPMGAAIDGLHFGVVRYNAGHRFKRS